MKTSRGFTLIELLVVVAIIGVLSSVIAASLNSSRIKARQAARSVDMRAIVHALELYATDHNGAYPPKGSASASDECNSVQGYTVNDCLSNVTELVSGAYISKMPVDPKPEVFGTNQNYRYCPYSGNRKYALITIREPNTGVTWARCRPPTPYSSDTNEIVNASGCGYSPGGVIWPICP